MELLGTIFNGQIRLDRPTDLPDGTRIVSLPADEYEDSDDFGDLGNLSHFEYPHPMAPYDAEKEAALIRASVAAVAAGGKLYSLDEVMAELDEIIRGTAKPA